jgi:hypothetical protein
MGYGREGYWVLNALGAATLGGAMGTTLSPNKVILDLLTSIVAF